MIDGHRLRQLREAEGYTRKRLAEELQISEAQLVRYEQGESDATTDILARLATFFEVTADYLIGLTNSPQPLDQDLHPEEAAVIAALRRGDYREAIKFIVEDE